jgi:hypothetical protein
VEEGELVARRSRDYNKRWVSLTPSEKATRVRALETVRRVREGQSLTKASRSVGISPRTAHSHLGPYLFKRKRRWHARAEDRIERALVIYERGRITQVVVKDSKTASRVGQYLNDVKNVLVSGDKSLLKKYRNRVVKDSNGKKHCFEVRIDKIKVIELSREEVEFSDIYAY